MFKDLRYSIAIHESGHALVGLSCGLHIFGMYIDPDDKNSGTKFRHEDAELASWRGAMRM